MLDALERGCQMKDVKVKRDELKKVLEDNLVKHKAAYAEAFEDYKEAAEKAIKAFITKSGTEARALLAKVKAAELGKDAAVPVWLDRELLDFSELRVPSEHSKSYEQVIRMLEMSVDETITLASDQFACYVMDDWGWKAEFEGTRAIYAAAKFKAR